MANQLFKNCSNGSRVQKFFLQFSYLLALGLMGAFSETSGSTSLPDVVDFFPQIDGDLTKVIWAHAVNSEAKLLAAIEGPTMMLEADILMGKSESSEELVPIMAHPPNSTSDLTFAGFLDTILKVNNDFHKLKGIKLDFKDIAAVEPVLSRLERESEADKLNFPIWLNADVLKGPIDATKEPINGSLFITLVKRYLPTATLSLGWTTRYGRDDFRNAEHLGEDVRNLKTIKASKSGYTYQNVWEMVHLLREKSWEGVVTFAVRAGLITPKESMAQLGRLMTEPLLESLTFTIWSVEDDPVNLRVLRHWIQFTQKGHVYLDLPFDLDQGPVLIPDPESVLERPLGRSDHLLSGVSGSSSTRLTMPYLFSITLILTLIPFLPMTN